MLQRFRNSLAQGLLSAGLLLALGAGADGAIDSAVDIESLALKDQYGVVGGLDSTAGELQIAIVVSAKRLRRIKPWEQAIRNFNDDLQLIRVADIPRSAPTEFSSVAAKLKKRLPEDLSVLVDLEGIWVNAFALDSSVPNILVFDGNGQLLLQHDGMFKKARYQDLEADLIELLTEPQSP